LVIQEVHVTMSERPSRDLREARNLRELVMAMRGRMAEVPIPPGVERIGVPGPSLGAGMDGEVHWFTDRNFPGTLFRVRWADGGLWLESPARDGGWTFIPGLLDYFIGKEMGAVEISEEHARAILTARGTDLVAHLGCADE
jgi:hypothetical protein